MAQPIAPDYGQQVPVPSPPWKTGCLPITQPASCASLSINWIWPPWALSSLRPARRSSALRAELAVSLKIWLYGYFHRLRSTRKLEAACHEASVAGVADGLIALDHNSLWRSLA